MNISVPPPRRAFTLVELLVAVSVLCVIVLLFSQMISLSMFTWRKGNARADNFTQARALLGNIERDLQSMVLRPDLAAFVDADGRPALAFYTLLPAANGTRSLSLVEYKLAAVSGGLLRYDLPFNYPPAANATAIRELADGRYELDLPARGIYVVSYRVFPPSS